MAGQYSAVTGYGLLIGRNTGTPVSHEYAVPFAFTGGLEKVVIDLSGDHEPDHEAGDPDRAPPGLSGLSRAAISSAREHPPEPPGSAAPPARARTGPARRVPGRMSATPPSRNPTVRSPWIAQACGVR